ncbi:MAG: alpha,alpha-trehalase TreF [Bacteroidota bacterium]
MKAHIFLMACSLLLFISCQDSVETPTEVLLPETKATLSPDERFGALFETVQLARIFPHSKTFSDCIPKQSTDQILQAYELRRSAPDFDLSIFIGKHFSCTHKKGVQLKRDTNRSLLQHINAYWSILTPQSKVEESGSLIALPHPFVLSSSKASEVYYWESYFTMLGLAAAGKEELLENMVDNFTHLIHEFGHIPSANRRYQLSRTGAPFYAAMIDLLASRKGARVYENYLSALEKEYQFWMKGRFEVNPEEPASKRVVRMQDGSLLNRYFDHLSKPRPEAYLEDIELAKGLRRNTRRVYEDIRAACESGWQFSSRWFGDEQYMASIHTTQMIPIDLNSLLYHLEITLSKAYGAHGDEEQKENYLQRAENRKRALEKHCWDAQRSIFLDYNFIRRSRSEVPSLAMLYPLYFNLANQEQADSIASFVQQYFLKPGGVVTTLNQTGQDWDAPHGWAPLQWITIQGLRNYGHLPLADTIQQRWVDLNTRVYKNSGKLLDKYNVEDMTLEDGGGEPQSLDAYAWTNGILLQLLNEKKQTQ